MAKEITCEVLKVLNEADVRDNVVRLRVITWNGKNPQIEKREFWYDEAGNEKMGKAKGFNLKDINLILENIEEIKKLMEDKNA